VRTVARARRRPRSCRPGMSRQLRAAPPPRRRRWPRGARSFLPPSPRPRRGRRAGRRPAALPCRTPSGPWCPAAAHR